jgi:hypothetical protein
VHLLHHVGEGDQVLDVEVGLVVEGLGRGVEVDVEGGAAVVVQVGDQGGAEGRLEGESRLVEVLWEDQTK